MSRNKVLSVCALALCFYLYAVVAQSDVPGFKLPRTRFTCTGRPSGYYADMDTGCQVYHMCDGLGRQFSYTCPNTTLFQQRMLICDHWYMVNCSMSERDYSANLLIGQRDKPFVSDEEMSQRTPRPDILSVPPNNNYYDGLREAESKYPLHPDNSIVGVADSIKSDNNGLDNGKNNYRPPTGWSTKRPTTNFNTDGDSLVVAASQRPTPTVQPLNIRTTETNTNTAVPNVTPPSRELVPPFTPPTTEATSEELQIDVRMKEYQDPVFTFIKRFDPYAPDTTPKTRDTAMTRTEILDLNKHLPDGQVSSEEDRTPRRNKDFANRNNKVQEDNGKGFTEERRFDSVNTKPTTPTVGQGVSVPDKVLVPPKSEFSNAPTTTVGPPIYYEWKWAVPAFDLAPPLLSNATNINTTQLNVSSQPKSQGKSPFRDVTRRPTPIPDNEPTPEPKNVEYNISSYFVPDYVFPLDKPHPGYESDDAQTSFQVQVAREGRSSFGENPACPQCHPAYLKPGSCEPCIVKR